MLMVNIKNICKISAKYEKEKACGRKQNNTKQNEKATMQGLQTNTPDHNEKTVYLRPKYTSI